MVEEYRDRWDAGEALETTISDVVTDVCLLLEALPRHEWDYDAGTAPNPEAVLERGFENFEGDMSEDPEVREAVRVFAAEWLAECERVTGWAVGVDGGPS